MNPASLTECVVEDAALDCLRESGYEVAYGPDIAPEEPGAEREDFAEVVVEGRLWNAVSGLNPSIPVEAHEDAMGRVSR